MPLSLHSEIAATYGPVLEGLAAAPKTAPHDLAGVRNILDAMINGVANSIPADPDIQLTTYEAPSYDGHIVKITRLAMTEEAAATDTIPPSPGPAVLYAHGGGFIHGDVATWTRFVQRYVRELNIPFFAVEYRLAPEHPFPAATEDLYAALQWLQSHADELGVDPARIATMGHSAGSSIAAALGIMARDRGVEPPIAKQILLYPALDDRNTAARPAIDPLTFWPSHWSIVAWNAYLGADNVGKDDVSPYVAPARLDDFQGLPKTYLDVGVLDILRDECISFAAGIAKEDIEVEVHVYPGMPHGFDLTTERYETLDRAVANRVAALKGV
ncbi:alpha/beta hydrolase fold-domain-containing protein [Aspergillus germanicus]